jgi:hypothetical protein
MSPPPPIAVPLPFEANGLAPEEIPAQPGRSRYWPNLPILCLPGWRVDLGISAGETPGMHLRPSKFRSFLTVLINGNAVRKSDVPDQHELAAYISTVFRETADPKHYVVSELSALKDGDGVAHRYFSITPNVPNDPAAEKLAPFGNWRLVAFGEEDEFYMTFILDAPSKVDLDAARSDFESVMAHYRKDLPPAWKADWRKCGSGLVSG